MVNLPTEPLLHQMSPLTRPWSSIPIYSTLCLCLPNCLQSHHSYMRDIFVYPWSCVYNGHWEGSRVPGTVERRDGGRRGRMNWFSAPKEGSASTLFVQILHKREPMAAAKAKYPWDFRCNHQTEVS